MGFHIKFSIILLFAIIELSKSSLVSSIAGLETVIQLEGQLINNFDEYITNTENKLNFLKRKLERARKEYEKAVFDPDSYLTNPINTYSLIRRMTLDWVRWSEYIAKDYSKDLLDKVHDLQKNSKYPTLTDLNESSRSFMRMQSTYNLKVADLTSGKINGVQYDLQLTALDTFELGIYSSNISDHYSAYLWLNETIKKFNPTEEYSFLGLTYEKIYLAAAKNMEDYDDLYGALAIYKSLLKMSPMSMMALTNSQMLEDKIAFKEHMGVNLNKKWSPKLESEINIATQEGCRGEYTTIKNKQLYCKWEKTHHPFLILAPFKTEIVHVNPTIVLYYDVVYTSEIESLKQLAIPALKRAIVYSSTKRTGSPVERRTSKTAWADDSSDFVKKINLRTMDMTGHSLSESETFQIMNYGIGGHHYQHLDAFSPPNNEQSFKYLKYKMGNRISTVLFYMSDVKQGGATVFPHLKLSVWPRRGSAVFWFNLDNMGTVNPQTLHAACPVLVGSKWVFNKWIRANGEMFTYPCVA